MGQLAGARARVGIPTLFNILGPLLNPLQPRRQFIGTAFAEYQGLLLEAGIALGRTQLYVARADDGLDEISVSAPTRILTWANGRRGEDVVGPQDFGLQAVPFEAVSVPNRGQSVAIAERILAGQLDSAHYQLVAANAAYLYRAFVAPELGLPEAYARAIEALSSGALGRQLEAYRTALASAQPLSAPAA
jgi:anthranilate phosphoribosyltransferase